jgi:elongation factor P
MANVSELKRGMVVQWKDALWAIVEFQHVSPGKGSAFTRTKLKHLLNGKVVENTFKATESLDFVDVERLDMQFLFTDGDTHTFMDTHSYEQVEIGADIVGDDAKYLKEGLVVNVSMNEGAAVTIQLPQKIEYKVTETEPAVKGDTASGNVTKESIMDNGLHVRVPIFINQDDTILVNTDTGAYSERVNK